MAGTGPDIPAIQCYTPDGCCGPSACDFTEDQFICQVRSLLPPGDIYNNTLAPAKAPVENHGAVTIGCVHVGCEQLILGGCCEDRILCDDEPVAPQLAVVDSYAAVAFGAVEALCAMLRELDPCTADITLHQWAARFGITPAQPCDPMWSDKVLAFLVCLLPTLRFHVMNWDFLTRLAAMFGAQMSMHYAGDFNCGPVGWWTMARTPVCKDDPGPCADPRPSQGEQMGRIIPPCVPPPPSLNIVMQPSDIVLPPNCNFPPAQTTKPHDPELYEAWKWLLPKILPQPALYCFYEADPANCITM